MAPPFMPQGPPIEVLVTELVYFLIVFALCMIIYFRTKNLYSLTQHKGIFYFRNIFLFFALAYVFRFLFIVLILGTDVHPRALNYFILPFVGFFSTMAILSLVTVVLIRKFKVNGLSWLLCVVAFLLSLVTYVTRSYHLLVLLQTLVFLFAIVVVFVRKKAMGKFFSQNHITFLLLFVFWILNIVAFNRRLIPPEFKIPLYVLSAAIFLWIFLRVHKRLAHAKA